MHKRLLNEAILELTIRPDGPILVKAGESGADPTRPDMEFVRTRRNGVPTIYLPGSTLKGTIRAHCERIVRSVGGDQPDAGRAIWSCDPLANRNSCSERLKSKKWTGDKIYHRSCFICQLFGHTSLAGHLRTADAYPDDPDTVVTEERNGVAIDRVFGSVAVGPFNFEVVTAGEFKTRLYVKNFTLAQLGLLALALRDLKLGRVSIGFGKSRGLGRVTMTFNRLALRYPMGKLEKGLSLPGTDTIFCNHDEVVGVGAFKELIPENYGYPKPALEKVKLPDGLKLTTDKWAEVVLELKKETDIERVWADACVPAWRGTAGLA